MRKAFLRACFVCTTISTATASEPGAQFVTKLFTDVCVPNLGHPEKLREWAQAHALAQIENPTALELFVGPGPSGAAWAIPTPQGSFALSIRGSTQACAVWARAADPVEALALFKQIVEGVRRPGIEVVVFKDETSVGPVGEARSLVYTVAPVGKPPLFLFTLLTAERSGGAFQVSMQAAHSTSP